MIIKGMEGNLILLVGVEEFESPTSWMSTKCSNQLNYTPERGKYND